MQATLKALCFLHLPETVFPHFPGPQAFYTFYLPVACGLRLAGVTNEAAYTLAEDLCCQMGQYFQVGTA